MSRNLIVLTLILGGISQIAAGQSQPQVPLNWYAEAEPHHASTVKESWLRGWAALWRSYGTYLYLRGQGAIGWEKAREHYLCNRESAIDAWYARKLFNHNFRFPARPKASFSQLVEAQRKAPPGRLSTNELSQYGRIYWPDLLMAEEFDEHRVALDKLFRTRTSGIQASGKSALRKAITDEAEMLHAKLRTRIREYTQPDYTAARKFIEKLRYGTHLDPRVVLARG